MKHIFFLDGVGQLEMTVNFSTLETLEETLGQGIVSFLKGWAERSTQEMIDVLPIKKLSEVVAVLTGKQRKEVVDMINAAADYESANCDEIIELNDDLDVVIPVYFRLNVFLFEILNKAYTFKQKKK